MKFLIDFYKIIHHSLYGSVYWNLQKIHSKMSGFFVNFVLYYRKILIQMEEKIWQYN